MPEKKHVKAVEKANEIIALESDKYMKSPYRLHYHFMSPVGWINDPNGFIKHNEEYHLFYQYHPYSAQWGPMHWGHAKSNDLVNWEHLPVALAPSENYDLGCNELYGCYSGSAVVEDGKLVLVYTGHVESKTPMEVQCIATSKDGINFEKHANNPVVDIIPEDGSKDFRDPKVFKYQDKWYMLVGTNQDEKGKAVLYNSDNLFHWEYLGVVCESDGTQGSMWECVNLFLIQNTHVLIVSPMYKQINGKPLYMVGDMDYKAGKFSQQFSKIIDYGNDFYAPNTITDDDGRVIMIGWMENWQSKKPSQKYGWAGAMTLPREIIMEDNIMKQKPIKELAKLRSNNKKYLISEIKNKITVDESFEQVSETYIEFDINKSTSKQFGVQLRCSKNEDEKFEILFNLEKNKITVLQKFLLSNQETKSEAPLTVKKDGTINLRIFLDISSVELFINDGETVITNRIYPDNSSNIFNIFSENGKTCVAKIESWELGSIW